MSLLTGHGVTTNNPVLGHTSIAPRVAISKLIFGTIPPLNPPQQLAHRNELGIRMRNWLRTIYKGASTIGAGTRGAISRAFFWHNGMAFRRSKIHTTRARYRSLHKRSGNWCSFSFSFNLSCVSGSLACGMSSEVSSALALAACWRGNPVCDFSIR
jgi:hypothetical protein